MASAGGSCVLPGYGPTAAVKAALESHVRQVAAELTPATYWLTGNTLLVDGGEDLVG